mgnify:FL=1
MANYLDGHIELLTLSDFTWRNKINSNFSTMVAYQTISAATYTVDASPPDNCTLDRILFLDASSNAITITLPDPTLFPGREIIFIVQDETNTMTMAPSSNIISNQDTIDQDLGFRQVMTSNGTKWCGRGNDN